MYKGGVLLNMVVMCLFQQGKGQEDAITELKRLGATFRSIPYYRALVDDEVDGDDRGCVFVTLDERWVGTRKDIQLLNQVSNLRELSLSHPKANDEWLGGFTSFKKLRGLFLLGPHFTDASLVRCREAHSLIACGLTDTSVSDEGLKCLRKMRELKWLKLTNTKIGNEGLRELEDLVELRVLYLEGTMTSGTGIKHLQKLTKMRELALSSLASGLKDNKGNSGLKSLSRMTSLEELSGPRNVIDEELESLAGLRRLRHLDLRYNDGITDRGVAHLAGLIALEHLDLDSASLTDRSGNVFLKMSALRHVNLANTRVSDLIVADLVRHKKIEFIKLSGTKATEKSKELAESRGIIVLGP